MSRQASQTKGAAGGLPPAAGQQRAMATEVAAVARTLRAATPLFRNHSHRPLAHLLAELAVGGQLDHDVGHGQQVQHLCRA